MRALGVSYCASVQCDHTDSHTHVSSFQLGGGCELALMCDIILASPTAVFGQPEINIGVIPGGGGTQVRPAVLPVFPPELTAGPAQRLAHAIGKSRTMELTLTGRNWTAKEASDWGMVSRVVGEGEGEVVKEAVDLARVIASKSAIAVQANKEAVNAAFEHTLAEGLKYERRIFHSMFATKDQKEGECCVVRPFLSGQGVLMCWLQVWLRSRRRGSLLGATLERRVAVMYPYLDGCCNIDRKYRTT